MEEAKRYEFDLAGRPFSIETGKLAKQANGSVLVRYGDTVVLVTATASSVPREGIDFFPLTIDYEERLYAVGRIPGGFLKREGRPTEKGILSARLTDRPIRPLFPEGFRNDVQVIATVLSVDHDCPFEICGLIGASAALTISNIPFNGPVGAVVVGLVDGHLIVNPTREQEDKSLLHLVVAGTKDAIMMIEAGAKTIPEEQILEAIFLGHETIKELIGLQEKMGEQVGRPKTQFQLATAGKDLEEAVRNYATESLRQTIMTADKLEREEKVDKLKQDVSDHFLEIFPEQGKQVGAVYKKIMKEEVRRTILDHGVRPDGRRTGEIRPIWCEVGLLPRTHGSAVFTRGQTQALSVVTLGTIGDVQKIDGLGVERSKGYLHHYSFPPYSVGETKPLRGPSRRDTGHGALAEKALLPVLPDHEQFPYTIRVVSEILESNGSSSMASVCGSTLSLMDAGVPLKSPVAGVAMGLVKEGERMAVLTDIQGLEDALGDMDFKVAGTREGVTAIQMDMKIQGIDKEILRTALSQAREGRLFIMDRMLEVLPSPRPELSPHAPRIIVTKIDPDKIREVIGPGGKTINKIIDATSIGDIKVDIEIQDDGTIHIAAVNKEAGERALQMILDLTREVEPGRLYHGRVMRVMNFGAFVEILPGKEGLVHISQLAEERVGRVEDVLNIGDEVTVLVTEIDRMGRINLSRKDALRKLKAEEQ